MVKIELHNGSPMVVKLEVGFSMDVPIMTKRCLRIVKLMMGLHHGTSK